MNILSVSNFSQIDSLILVEIYIIINLVLKYFLNSILGDFAIIGIASLIELICFFIFFSGIESCCKPESFKKIECGRYCVFQGLLIQSILGFIIVYNPITLILILIISQIKKRSFSKSVCQTLTFIGTCCRTKKYLKYYGAWFFREKL